MKKSTVGTCISLCILLAGVSALLVCWHSSVRNDVSDSVSTADAEPPAAGTHPTSSQATSPQTSSTPPTVTTQPPSASMSGALFIGDSRTVGLMEYAGLEEADFFCTVGMSVYNIQKKSVSVPGIGKITLTELLSRRQYRHIYVMLGINEVGYKISNTVAQYRKLLSLIQSSQPEARLFIQANLHVSKSRSDKDAVVNNQAIDALNKELSRLADGTTVFYLDVNPEFDDAQGGLAADKTEDGTHLYAKYYRTWGAWIAQQTAVQIGEE